MSQSIYIRNQLVSNRDLVFVEANLEECLVAQKESYS